MRKVFLMGVGLSLNLLGLARLGEAQFRDNQLSIGVS
jgi:hypothetical protein